MPFQHHWAFIDESGNESLLTENHGVSDNFVISAVIVEDAGLDLLSSSIESIRKIHFQSGEMKSSSIGNEHTRRLRILENLANTKLSYITLIVDKNEIQKNSGLQFKKSFRKFITGMVYNRLYRTFPNITVISDQHGGEFFMSSVKTYVEKYHKPSLFDKQDFLFRNSSDEILIQAADFIAGTWAKISDESIDSEIRKDFKEIIKTNAIFIDHWPPSTNSIFPPTEDKSHLNSVVRQYCYNQIHIYILKNQDKSDLDEEEKAEEAMRIETIRFLLHKNEFLADNEFLYSHEIIEHLQSNGFEKMTPRKLAAIVIAPLRDNGVIISSGSKGYRVPTTVRDIVEFAKTTGEKVLPMLTRLGMAKKQLYLVSNKSLDIVEEAGYPLMNKLIEII